MNKKHLAFIYLLMCCSMLFSTEPSVSKSYYIHNDKTILYLGMEISEIEDILGKPNEIEIVRLEDPLHNLDRICWKYNGIQVSFYDIASRIVTKIVIPNENTAFMIGQIIPSKSRIEEIKKIYGDPDFIINKDDGFLYYQYDISPFQKFPYTFILQFRFNFDKICDEIIFQRDDF